jgi:hypothetical protein
MKPFGGDKSAEQKKRKKGVMVDFISTRQEPSNGKQRSAWWPMCVLARRLFKPLIRCEYVLEANLKPR